MFGGSMAGSAKTRETVTPSVGMDNRPKRSDTRGSAATRTILFLLTVFAVFLIVIWGISSRRNASAQLSQETHELAIPVANVVHPRSGAPQQEIVLPGSMQPFIDAPIYARTNGYLKAWYVDIGTRVKSGQLLAEIDAPEVDQQLLQARADLQTAESNMH